MEPGTNRRILTAATGRKKKGTTRGKGTRKRPAVGKKKEALLHEHLTKRRKNINI